ncbi:hypothetical protein VC83_06395 [Pseudogymnoascus destructans]|uniref:Uncharacterized protein n=2 Tax=Pseudogymnoascus destructans TaxID=655981 RepID=L8GAS0_PSED2|nr:uncharacterized protein VC83_06395 [Pseudogymnoascus destructans]ELR09994.1 hypothetical protein GMDG_00752 [Pseudogymnoascus destructans 20631-21]OAF58302.1 hypothetical protein VC83_06395 [Pseudogymnoascus destructans]
MRLSFGLLLPVIAGVAHATSSRVDSFVFTASKELDAGSVSLTPEQVRVVLAQQLDVTQYHRLGAGDRSEKELKLINTLGGQHPKLFDEDVAGATSPRHLVVFLDVSLDGSKALKAKWSEKGRTEPSFVMVGSPGRESVGTLVRDIQQQISPRELPNEQCTLTKAIDVSASECWHNKNSHIMHKFTDDSSDFDTFVKSQDSLFSAIEKGDLEATFLLMTPGQTNRFKKQPWGSYSLPASDSDLRKREQEQPMSDIVSSSSSSTLSGPLPTSTPIGRLPPLCYNTLESCTTSTQNCSGHGACFRKFGPAEGASGASCFACKCYGPDPTDKTRKGYWGGAACQKQDISAQFWIIAGFSALLIGIVSYAIGMMFSIGSEKLPGVIGAGVAAKTR